ncbi:MAG: aspartate/glutamate racemase family protein [Anaerolineaceae bacterium]|nr:aspartate/glutamate racemase family protein [Anaerolineaceae bacterium]
MKTIGMIGGMSWESSLEYYRIVNERVASRLGGVHSAKSLMISVDFAEIETLQREGRWEEATQMMVEAAQSLQLGGADFIVICTNTMHKMADEVAASVSIPLLHIADATAEQIVAGGLKRIGLLGTRFTMEEDFYKGRLEKKFGLDVLTPEKSDRDIVHRVIYEELVLGKTEPASKAEYLRVIEGLHARGAEGIILGCTEIGLLVKQSDCSLPLFDTTLLHAEAAVEFALKAA